MLNIANTLHAADDLLVRAKQQLAIGQRDTASELMSQSLVKIEDAIEEVTVHGYDTAGAGTLIQASNKILFAPIENSFYDHSTMRYIDQARFAIDLLLPG